MELKIWYSVQNGGDGSAYPAFYESERIAEMDQDLQPLLGDSGWGESCTGCVTVKGDNLLCEEMTSEADFLAELKEHLEEECDGGDDNSELSEKLLEFITLLEENPLPKMSFHDLHHSCPLVDDLSKDLTQAIKQFGEYTFYDKGPDEVMYLDKYDNALAELPIAEVAQFLNSFYEFHPDKKQAKNLIDTLIQAMDERKDFEDLWEYDIHTIFEY